MNVLERLASGEPTAIILAILAWLAFWNIKTFLHFAVDKQAARLGTRREREVDLMGGVAFGGALGGMLASQLLRHKTRKQPFADTLFWHFAVQSVLLAGLLLGALVFT